MKKFLIIIAIAVAITVLLFALVQTGVIRVETAKDVDRQKIEESKVKTADTVQKVSTLKNGSVYVYHGDGNFEEDVQNKETSGVFEECGKGTLTFQIKSDYKTSGSDSSRVIWLSSKEEGLVPVLDANKGDKLVFCSKSASVLLPISIERFYDGGYTIGFSNLEYDDGGHVYVHFNTKEPASQLKYVNPKSDASAISEVTQGYDSGILYIDKIGDTEISYKNLTANGTLSGLEKDKSYLTQMYTGTIYQDFVFTADHRVFTGVKNEFFKWTEYRFLHSNIAEVLLPDFLKTGYYFINGTGMIHYIAKGDTVESPVNVPIVEYDEDGTIINPEVFESGVKKQNADAEIVAVEASSTETSKTYTINAEREFAVTVRLSNNAIQGQDAAVLKITDPTGKVSEITERNNEITYSNKTIGNYVFVVENIGGRIVQFLTD